MEKVSRIKRLKPVKECRVCGKRSSSLSRNGHCAKCAAEKANLARCQIRCKEGEAYERWKEGMLKSISR